MSDAALDATADALTRRALAALPETPSRTDVDALAPPLARVLAARLDAELDRATPTTDWVDAEATADAREAWREAARASLHLPAAVRDAEVEGAVRRALEHLIRPADTLAAVAFEGEAGALPVETVLSRIRAFGPYPYLAQITERYVERKDLTHLDRAGLERLLRRIDRRMVSAIGPDEWLMLLEPLVAWAGPAGHPPGTLPTALLRPLFQAKGATALHDALDEIDTVDPATLRGLLTSVLAPDPAPRLASEPGRQTGESDRPAVPVPPPQPESQPISDVPPAPSAPDAPEAGPPEAGPPEASPPEADAFEAEPSEKREAGEPEADDEAPDVPRPPVIGSRYGSPEFEAPLDSVVLGAPRPVPPMDAVRDAVTEPAESAPTPPVVRVPAPDVPSMEPVAPPDLGSAGEPPPEEEPLWQRLARERGAEPATPPEPADEDVPLWKRFAQSDLAERLPEPTAPPSDPPPGAPVPDDRPSGAGPSSLDELEARVLGAEASDRRAWYIDELFGGSPAEYHRTLAAIDRAASYTDATALISSEVLRKRRVNPYTDCAVAFIDAVQERFERS